MTNTAKDLLVGLNAVKKRLADGSVTTYYYAWRGKDAPRVHGEYGSAEFIRNFRKANGLAPLEGPTIDHLISDYREDELPTLGSSTQADYERHLKRISSRFGKMTLKSAQTKAARKKFLAFRAKVAAKHGDSEADYCWTVLRRLIYWAIDDSEYDMSVNRASRGGKLKQGGSRNEIVWTPDDVAAFDREAPLHLRQALRLLLFTGLRRESAVKVPWTAYKHGEIHWRPSKGVRYNRKILIPVYEMPLLGKLLDDMPKRATTIITSSVRIARQDNMRRPYTPDGFSTSCDAVRARAGITRVTLHDTRGTFVSHAKKLGWDVHKIARTTGWSTKAAEKMIDIYGARLHQQDVDLEACWELLRTGT